MLLKPTKILLPAAWLHAGVMRLRNWCYDRGIFNVVRFSVPVISVGNLTAGGTGKTPFVEYCVRFLTSTGFRVGILSRGYRRSTKGFRVVSDGKGLPGSAETMGDEPRQIAMKFPAAIVVVDEDRARGAREMIDRFHPDVIVLDDGFQHRRLGRSLDIVMMAGRGEPEDEPMLPAGLRREPVSALRRADLIVRNHKFEPGPYPVPEKVEGRPPELECRYEAGPVIEIGNGRKTSFGEFSPKRVVLFCGIADPGPFEAAIRRAGHTVAGMHAFPDHHPYSAGELEMLAASVRQNGADGLMTTEKDAVRLPALPGGFPACWYLEIRAVLTCCEERFHDTLLKAAGRT